MTRKLQVRQSTITAMLGCLLLGAQAAYAQLPEPTPTPIAHSQELQRNAQDMLTSPERWQDAAALLTQAARLRSVGDPEKQRMLATAARTFTEAAYLAGDRGDWGKVRELAQRVETLMGSPLLTDEQRESIRRPFAAQAVASAAAAAGQTR